MNRIVRILAAVAVVAINGCSASSPQDRLKEVVELQQEGFPIAPEQVESIDRHTAEGKTKEASEAFAKAIDVLKLAQNAYTFNKAD